MRKIGEGMMLMSKEKGMGTREKEDLELAKTIMDTTKNITKMSYANDVMSSLLAKIASLIREKGVNMQTRMDNVEVLLEWYDAYQAGVLSADIVGTKLSEKSK